MCNKFILVLKIGRLSFMVRSMEKDIISYKNDMVLMNDLYYCGRGDVDKAMVQWMNEIYFKIAACVRLKEKYERILDKLNGVVGA